MTDLRDIFSRLTSLRHLSMMDFYPKLEQNPPEPFTFYPTLKSLTFQCSVLGVYDTHYPAFWAVFNVPATASFRLWGYAEVNNFDEDVEGFMDPLSRIDDRVCPAKELVIGNVDLVLWCGENQIETTMFHPPYRRLYPKLLEAAVARSVHGGNDAVKYNVPRLPLESLSCISTVPGAMERLNKCDPDSGWISKLSTARNVRRVCVYYTYSQPLLDDLPRRDANDAYSLFPLLETIVFHHDVGEENDPGMTSLGLILLEVLADRKEHGAPIVTYVASGSWGR